MKELKFVLDNAKQILAVSSPFAQLYRNLGFANVRVVENGVSDLPVLKRTSSDTAKVRIAHIGGKSFHKGFNHLRAALSDLKCHNIEVLLIDHALSPGEESLTVWGASVVRVRESSHRQMWGNYTRWWMFWLRHLYGQRVMGLWFGRRYRLAAG